MEEAGTLKLLRSWSEFRGLMRESPHGGRSWNDLAYAVYGFYLNGGTRCLVVECGEGEKRDLTAALDALAEARWEVAMVAAPGRTDIETYAALVAHCEKQQDRLAILDGPAQPDDTHLAVMAGTAGVASDGWRMPPASGFATLYVPWLTISDPEGPSGASVLVPPSGYIAGIWAANDSERGVWKAPAGLPVLGALDLSRRITEAEQAGFNPRGVNALRYFPNEGIVVWGARTLADRPEPEWKYVNVRRLMMMIESSISRGTRWAVFEPNDEPLWARVRVSIEKFLLDLWRSGALVGNKPEEAYFVRCDRSTMTPADLDAGRGICLIGVAATRPAEFVTWRLAWQVEGAA
jgi:phage tail sheath protein FI